MYGGSSSSQHEQQSQMGATNTTFGVVTKPEPVLKPTKIIHKKSASNDVKVKPKVPIFKKVPSAGKNGIITFAPVSTSP